MKLVAVSQRVDVWADRGETRDALDQRLVTFLAEAGLLAVPVPNAPGQLSAWLDALPVEGVVLSGGNDIGQRPERDATEVGLLEWATVRHLPALGICRGMQMMVVKGGGTLARVEGHVRVRHCFALAGESPQDVEVNSYHDWGVATLPPLWNAFGCAPDGTVEAMRHKELPWQGWMWHPEREAVFQPADIGRARNLFQV